MKEEKVCGYDQLCSERRGEAGPMIEFRPLHTPPIRPLQTGVDSTEWIEIEPPVYMLGGDADDANDKAHDLVMVLTLNAELWAERTLDEEGFRDTWQSLF